ncbi:MAG: flagellar assembly protein FliH [Thiobacillus sp.]|nr:flagellar assembly protein FliH [Gammaproteobacteria bacterium]MDP1925591.1 flagellar assembly protein FliH [Thiobacillus sp.]MDP3124541.1 flagellar assembly protein FliH [Thiobacillus sp.]
MSSCVIRKEDQPACLPWEMASFESSPHGLKQSESAALRLPTIDDISAIQEQARQEGYASGHSEGHAAGMATGLAEGRELAAVEAARLSCLAESFTAELDRADETISQQVLDLTLDLARAVVKSALAVRPELILPIVREAVRYLPSLQQPALLYLNPGDVELVQTRMGNELTKMGWQLTEDPDLEPGSCRAETPDTQIDSSLSTRWHRLTAALGKDSNWLAD